MKYSPSDAGDRGKEAESAISHVTLLELKIENITGKQAKELLDKPND